jgi:NAD(P)-dependent dehydrogenase (short-subunit alcohol dehydrogenase family)
MNLLNGRVAVITGAGRGIGREYALLFASEGARVVVNDLGGSPDGSGADASPADDVVAEIRAAGGTAVANGDDISTAEGADRLIAQAVDIFGELHVLVNNAGILRDRTIVNTSEEDWDAITRVHLRGHFLPTRAAARYWRERTKSGQPLAASLVNTSSTSGLFGNVGQTGYGAVKSGIASFTVIAQMELERYGVRCNAIAPGALTRLTAGIIPEAEPETFYRDDPANIAPFVAYLAMENCPLKGQIFYVRGGSIGLFQPWTIVDHIERDRRWTIEEIQAEAARFADVTFKYRSWE